MSTKDQTDNSLNKETNHLTETNQANFTVHQQVLKQSEFKLGDKQNQQKLDKGKEEKEKSKERKQLQYVQQDSANLFKEQKVRIEKEKEEDEYKNDFLDDAQILHESKQEALKMSDEEMLTVQNNKKSVLIVVYQTCLKQIDGKDDEKIDKYRVLKMKDGQIKRKLRIFKQQLDNQSKQSPTKKADLLSHEILNAKKHNSFDHRKVREANEFISKIQQKKREDRRRLSENLERKNREMEQKKSIEKERMIVLEQEKRKRIEKGIEEKLKKRKLEQQQNKNKMLEIKMWSKSFKSQKPFHIRKQEEFVENEMINGMEKQKEKLFELKLQRRPIDFDEIDEHQVQYLEKRKYDEIKNEVQIEYEREQQRKLQKNQAHYYKGKYRYLILQELLDQKIKSQQDPKIAQREKKQRELLYGYQASQRILRKRYEKQSRTLELPNEQFKQFKKRTRNTDGTVTLEVKSKNTASAKEEGYKNFYFMKNLVREKGIRLKMNQNQTLPQKIDESSPTLKVRKQVSIKNSPSRIYENVESPIKSVRDLDSLLTIERRLQQKLKRAALLKKHGGIDRKEDQEMEDNQLNAVKMKLRLVRQCD